MTRRARHQPLGLVPLRVPGPDRDAYSSFLGTVPGVLRLDVRSAIGMAAVLAALLLPAPEAGADTGTLRTRPALADTSFPLTPWRVEVLDSGVEELVLTDADGYVVPFTGRGFDGRFVHLPSLLPGDYVLSGSGLHARFQVQIGGGEDAPMMARIGDVSGMQAADSTPYALAVGAVVLAGVALLQRGARRIGAAVVLMGLSAVALAYTLGIGSPAPDTIEECVRRFEADLKAQDRCVLERSTYTLVTAGVRPAVLELRDARPQGCHEVGHELGRRAWLLAGPEESVQQGLDLCYNAYYHGVLYGAATYMPDEPYLELLRTLCVRIYSEDDPNIGSCAHGVGHGASMRLGGDLRRAEEVCFRMSPSAEEHVLECRGAAVGEHVKAAHANLALGVEPPPPGEGPLEVCREIDPEVLWWCYQGTAMGLKMPAGSGAYFLGLCVQELDPGPERLECIKGMAVEMRSTHSPDPSDMSVCLVLTLQGERDVCGFYAAYGLYMLRDDPAAAEAACSAAQVTPGTCESIWNPEGSPAPL